jgi:hypothetical protein
MESHAEEVKVFHSFLVFRDSSRNLVSHALFFFCAADRIGLNTTRVVYSSPEAAPDPRLRIKQASSEVSHKYITIFLQAHRACFFVDKYFT